MKKFLMLGYICFYPNCSGLNVFLRLLESLLKDKSSFSGHFFSQHGKKDFRKKSINIDEIEPFIKNISSAEFNSFFVRGKSNFGFDDEYDGKVNFEFSPTPLDSVWSKLEKINLSKFSHSVQSTLRGLASTERYTFGRGIADYPNIISIGLELEEKNYLDSDKLHKIGERIANSMCGINRWILALDANPYIPPFIGADFLIGRPDKVSIADKFFYVPHLTVAGKAEVLNLYVTNIESSFPNVKLLKTVSPQFVVSLKNWEDKEKIFLPKWHEYEK